MDLKLNNKKLQPPKNIKISHPKRQGQLTVTWDNVANKADYVQEIYYNVYRGTSINAIFYKLNRAALRTNLYEDKKVGKNPNTTYFYKVQTVYLNSNGKVIKGKLSKPVKYEVTNTNRWFKKINERNMWILKNTGELFDLYKRKTEGERCSCWDSNRGQAATKDCDICFGTGFVGGYEPMMQLYVRQKPAQTSLDITNGGYQYNNTPGAWTISTVKINNRDILINPQGTMFQVINSHISHAAGVTFHQELSLGELDPNDDLYKMKREALYPDL